MLDVGRELLEEFAKLDKAEQERRINEMPVHEVDFLIKNGYEIIGSDGRAVIVNEPSR
jgi:hypothetical protein